MTFNHLIQIVPTLISGDAISNYAQIINKFCLNHGILSTLVANHTAQDFPIRTISFDKWRTTPLSSPENSTILYHHSIGSECADALVTMGNILAPCRRMMYFHNITPPEFFDKNMTDAIKSWEGFEQLDRLRPMFGENTFAASKFSARTLTERGWSQVTVLPLALDAETAKQLEKTAQSNPEKDDTLLFVGCLLPHKRVETLIRAIKYIRSEPSCSTVRLVVVGDRTADLTYTQTLTAMAEQLFGADAADIIRFTGKLPQEELIGQYSRSRAFVTASRYEGFCMPLVEAMCAMLPIVAVESGAISETLAGGAGLVVDDDDAIFAEACITVLNDKSLQEKMIRAQQQQKLRFSENNLSRMLLQ